MLVRLAMLLVLVCCICVLVSRSAVLLLPPTPQLSFTAVVQRNDAPQLYLYDLSRHLLVAFHQRINTLMTPVRSLGENEITAGRAALAHDRSRILIAAIVPPSNVLDLHLVDVKTGTYRNLTNTEFTHETQPAWSHDNRRIAYQVLGNPYTAIGFATPFSQRRRIVYLSDVQALNIWDLQWTPDNRAVVFGASMAGGQHLCFLQVGDEIPDCPLQMRSLVGIRWRPPQR
ncbi:MAG: hypothetical protein SF123_23490 [Chloroflexota bacterium]|nr:hypothetical protein [Chloroflexota bacterium]